MNKETQDIEYKGKLTDDLEKTVSAFLNCDGGKIYIGMADDDTVVGVPNPDDVQLKIADRLKDNIRPSILGLFDVYTEQIEGKTVVVINLASGMEKPYYIKQKGLSESGCFIRVASSAQPMPEALIKSLTNKRHAASLVNLPSRHQDLTFKQLQIFYQGKDKELNDNFAKSLELYTPDGQYNYLAYLLADTNNVSIRIGKYAGDDKSELIENEEYGYCSLIKAMQKVLDKFDIENVTQARIRGLKPRMEKKLVDRNALRETIINAFAHNDYSCGDTPVFEIFSDKFVVTSYGGLVEGLTLEEFYSGTSKPRNREIMKIFKDLEFVEHLGLGMPKIISKYGQEAVKLGGCTLKMTLSFDREMGDEIQVDQKVPEKCQKSARKVPEKCRKILEIISENPHISRKELADRLLIGENLVKSAVQTLKKNGIIRRIGANKGGYWEIVE